MITRGRAPANPHPPAPAAARPMRQVAAVGRSAQATTRMLTLVAGTYLIRATMAPALSAPDTTMVHILVPPHGDGPSNGVTIANSNYQFVVALGGVTFAKVKPPGGTILAVAFGFDTATERSIDLDVVRLDTPPRIQAADALGPTPQEVPTVIGLRIERLGWRHFASGGWSGSRGRQLRVQELAVTPLDPDAEITVELKAFAARNRETDWVPGGKPAGFDGDEVELAGFAARIVPQQKGQLSVVYFGAFLRGGEVGPCRDGDSCVSPIRDDPLVAVNMWISDRAPGEREAALLGR